MSIARARQLRNGATPVERHLWMILRTFRERGYHFRRQVPIGRYYADVACHHAMLVIEADGISHANQSYDGRRDDYMRSRGFRVLRFSNSDIVGNPDGVFMAIEASLEGIAPLAPTPGPSPQGGGVPRSRRLRTGLNELSARTGAVVSPPTSSLRGGGGGVDDKHQADSDT